MNRSISGAAGTALTARPELADAPSVVQKEAALRLKVQRPQTSATEDFPMPPGWRELLIGKETPR